MVSCDGRSAWNRKEYGDDSAEGMCFMCESTRGLAFWDAEA